MPWVNRRPEREAAFFRKPPPPGPRPWRPWRVVFRGRSAPAGTDANGSSKPSTLATISGLPEHGARGDGTRRRGADLHADADGRGRGARPGAAGRGPEEAGASEREGLGWPGASAG